MKRRAFTVTELLVVLSILALLTAMSVAALANAAEQARAQRTEAIIRKIDSLIMERWESYRTRSISYKRDANPIVNARNRLNALRELQRLELPQNGLDIWDNPEFVNYNPGPNLADPSDDTYAIPAVNRGYRRRAVPVASWNEANEEAECLYMIVASMRDGDKSALEFFTQSEIGDLDQDGMPEILDGWGRPLVYLRWPSGYLSDDPVSPAVTMQATSYPDPFDPLRVDSRGTYALKPLIFSMGPDGRAGINFPKSDFRYAADNHSIGIKNDPYGASPEGVMFGSIADRGEAADNITNHAP